MAVLTAAALVVFIIEAQIPLPTPLPGAKLGLSNAVTLFALYYSQNSKHSATSLSATDAFAILICRIFLGAILTGRALTLILSLSGGVIAFLAQITVKRFVTGKQVWVCGAIGAVFHNVGQVLAAIIIMGTPAIAAYLPVLIIIGIISGTLTGLAAQFTLDRFKI
ncbi:MAG: Gx transporter family protein [Oscillospiraceae bacterium]|nr:Gx transporter family protein [Oscillospiraceae bacterium]MCL2227903.1 Gx transporter family protein [Oscillospiraceae bacterium]